MLFRGDVHILDSSHNEIDLEIVELFLKPELFKLTEPLKEGKLNSLQSLNGEQW